MQRPGLSASPQSAPGAWLQNMLSGQAAAPRVPQISPVALPWSEPGPGGVGSFDPGAVLAPHAATKMRIQSLDTARRYHAAARCRTALDHIVVLARDVVYVANAISVHVTSHVE